MTSARTLMLGGAYAMAAGVLATWLVGYPPQPIAAAVLLVAVLLATGLAWALVAHRGHRAIAGFAGLLAVLLVAGLGWSWLSDIAAPSIEASGAHGHGEAAAAGGVTSIPVTALRTPTAAADGDVHAVEMTAARHDVTLASGDTIQAWGFGGDGLAGPELRVTEGDLVEVTLENRDIEPRRHTALAPVRRPQRRGRRRRRHAGLGRAR